MRFRYLILGILVAIPAGTLAHVWPQMPAYRIPGGRRFLADDPEQRQLLFLLDHRKEQMPPVIQRFDATSGRLVSEMALQGKEWDPQLAYVDSSLISKDLKTLAVFDFVMNDKLHITGMTGFFHETLTGKRTGEFSLGQFTSKGFSADGKWFALVHRDSELVVVDTQNCERRFDAAKPISTTSHPNIAVVFLADGKHLLIQWHIAGEDGQKVHAMNLQNGETRIVGQLPADHKLFEHHLSYVRSFKPHVHRTGKSPTASWLGHEFDGERLSHGLPDPSFGSDFSICYQPYLAFESESFVSQHESYPDKRSSPWIAMCRNLESLGAGKFVDLPQHDLGGCVRLIDRASGQIQFEKEVAFSENCRFIMGGSLMMLDPRLGMGSFSGVPPKPSTPPPFEIYRTDPWPRWIWTMLSVVAVLFAFALFARWRHLEIRRRAIAVHLPFAHAP